MAKNNFPTNLLFLELLAFRCENMTENIVFKPGMDDYSIGRRLSHVTHDSIILSPENFKIRNGIGKEFVFNYLSTRYQSFLIALNQK